MPLVGVTIIDCILQAALNYGAHLWWAEAQLFAFMLTAPLWWKQGLSSNARIPWWWFLFVGVLSLSLRSAAAGYFEAVIPLQILIVAALTAAVQRFGLTSFPTESPITAGRTLFVTTPFIVASFCLLRLLYSGQTELLSQEAYYWKYAENLSHGYLDHPPAVAVLIAWGQSLFGINEIGVRIGAMVCWFITSLMLARLATEWFGPSAGRPTILLMVILPLFGANGLYMTPDAPLFAAWAVALWALHRALLRQQGWAWYVAGAAIGIGLLSKYPMVLIGPAIVLYMLIDRDSRHWFKRPQPYSAALIAVLLFSPVLFWNATHEWASFTFQGARRFEAEPEFGLHLYLAFLALILTPVGLWVSTLFTLPAKQRARFPWTEILTMNRRIRTFILTFAGAPLGVFLYASLSQEIKVNWLGPPLLILVPLLAVSIMRAGALKPQSTNDEGARSLQVLARGWLVTAIVVVSGAAVFLAYIGGQWSLARYPSAFKKFLGREMLAAVVREQEERIFNETGSWPIVVGADSHYIGSSLGFYRAKLSGPGNLPAPTQGRHLFGEDYSLMYRYWSFPREARGRDIVMVSRSRADVSDERLQKYFTRLEEVQVIAIRSGQSEIASYYLRVGRNYSSEP
jgi:dolichol-phosphate mannosyltransferase